MGRRKIHYTEIEVWRGKYDAINATELAQRTWARYSDCLERFFSYFPKLKRLDEVTRLHVRDYEVMRQRDGASPTSIKADLAVVRSFYNWVIPASGLPLINPAAKTMRLDWP